MSGRAGGLGGRRKWVVFGELASLLKMNRTRRRVQRLKMNKVIMQ